MNRLASVVVTLALAAPACGNSPRSPAAATAPPPAPAAASGSGSAAPAEASVLSADILAREPVANTATVKHILISWKDLADAFQGHLDPRAANRSKADAEALVRSLLKQLEAGADFDALMKANSEDISSARSNSTFTVTPDAGLVIEFRQLSLRLHPGEIGVCQSDFGFHIIKRFS